MRVKIPRPSGTMTEALADLVPGPLPLHGCGRGTRSRRPGIAWVPVMAFMVVVLPAPLEPISDTSSPSRDLEVDALDGLDAAVGDLQARDSFSKVRCRP